MNKKIVISGWYGFGNIGDEAILQAMIDTFEKEYPNCNITVLSYNPEYTKRVQRVDAVYQIPIGKKSLLKNIISLRWIATLKAIKNCDIFIMGGGGFLSDWQPEVPKGWLKQMKIAKFFGKKTMLYGIGAGPFLTEKGEKETKYYIDNFVDEVTVRDKTSFQNLNNLKLKKNICLTKDPVMDLKINININRQNIIGLNFVELFKFESFDRNESKFNKYIKSLEYILVHLKENHHEYKLEFVSFFETDREFYKKYFNKFNIEIIEPANYLELVERMNNYSLFIGTRFHSLIFSIKTKTPTIGIVYQHKNLDLCNEHNISYETISDGTLPPLENVDINSKNIIEYINVLLNQKDSIR